MKTFSLVFAAVVAVSETFAKLIFLFGSPTVTRENLMQSSDTMFIPPDMLAVAETVALAAFLLTLAKTKQERIKRAKKQKGADGE